MQILRFRRDPEGESLWGWVSGERIGLIEGSPFGPFRRKDPLHAIGDLQILPPVSPSKIICVGRNYAAHAAEHQAEIPELPLLFLKPPSAIIGPGMSIHLPPQSAQVEHEAELAVVIQRRGRWLTTAEAGRAILGYTIANDVTARDLQRQDDQWTRGKGFDTFCPIGPWVETELDPADLLIQCRVNDQLRQMASTRDMITSVKELVAYASSIMTLEPGDVLLTGTPAGVGLLEDGDEVKIEIEGIGVLSNPVRSDPQIRTR
jgi:2-keto-4-pentenoate hydratase/2-oxohepta-3-ene-1,7-dioic acid hydratase in catechol pathway